MAGPPNQRLLDAEFARLFSRFQLFSVPLTRQPGQRERSGSFVSAKGGKERTFGSSSCGPVGVLDILYSISFLSSEDLIAIGSSYRPF